jgi:NTP pyrophosphatase (non-canonical NTP hydrolase)
VKRVDAFSKIVEERDRQDEKWGDQSHLPSCVWQTILSEEIGEIAQECLSETFGDNPSVINKANENLRNELIQAAAVIVAWLEGDQF